MNIQIETTRLILRPFESSDAAAASYNSKQPTVSYYMPEMVKDTEETARGWIRYVNENLLDVNKPCVLLAIQLKSDETVIGCIFVHTKPELNNELEIGYLIADEYHNKGYATEASKAMIWWTFEKAGQDLLSAIVKPENSASRRVIEKLGFVYVDTRVLLHNGVDCEFDYFRLYHTDNLPGPEWDLRTLCQAEPMGDFFKARAEGYNDHMLSGDGRETYKQLGKAFPATDEAVRILDLGCGTGIELDYIWERVPNAHITCIDISGDMLTLLVKNHLNRSEQITVIEASYLDWDFPRDRFDFAVSVQTMHHFEQKQKIEIYRNINEALKPGGCYIESDFYVDAAHMEQYRRRFEIIASRAPEQTETGAYHIDIPNTIDIQRQLLSDAGFQTVDVVEAHIRPRWSGGIVKARK